MAPPTIAPPISPAATPAATPRCALAGVTLSDPAIVAIARKAASVVFISLALLEMALAGCAGFKRDSSHRVFRTGVSELAAALDKRTNSQSEVNAALHWPEITVFFRPSGERRREKIPAFAT